MLLHTTSKGFSCLGSSDHASRIALKWSISGVLDGSRESEEIPTLTGEAHKATDLDRQAATEVLNELQGKTLAGSLLIVIWGL